MVDVKKAAADGFSIDSGRGKCCLQASDNPHDNCTTSPERGQGFIEALLSRGAENAIPLQQLVTWTGGGTDGRA